MWLVEFFWRGNGYLVPLIVIIVQVIIGAIGSSMSNDMYGRDVGHTPVIVGWLISAVLIWFIGKRMNRVSTGQDQNLPDGVLQTGKPGSVLSWQHSLLWIPFEYWSFICVGFAAWRYVS